MTDAAIDYDPFDPQVRANPYPIYRRLRDAAPVYWAGRAGACCISRDADVLSVLRRPQDFSSEAMRTMLVGGSAGAAPLSDPRFLQQMIALAAELPFPIQGMATARNLIAEDPPSHDRLGRIVNRGFTPRHIAAWERRARTLAEDCLASLRQAQRFDLVAELAHPDQLGSVGRDPGLVPDLVEEVLRYDSPVQLLLRRVGREIEIAGQRIPAGGIVMPLIGSANRDERQFERPDAFDVRRELQGHLAFGFGAHFCLGASLARLEARVALEALIPELPGLARSEAAPERVDSFLVRGPRRLELLRAA